MTRAQAEKLAGRLVVIRDGAILGLPADYQGEPGIILGADHDSLVIGWADRALGIDGGWGHQWLFSDCGTCESTWYVSFEDVDLLPPGAAVARSAR